MDFAGARGAVLAVLKGTRAGDRPRLLRWMRTTNDLDEFMLSNNDVLLRSIAEDLRNCLPIKAMLNSEHLAIQKILQQPEPTVHVDAFLYDDDSIDSLCEKGKMSRNYCVVCGSHKTAPLEFISHSFSLMELKFIYQYVLPDLTGKILVDVGSRLGAVLYGSISVFLPVEVELDLLLAFLSYLAISSHLFFHDDIHKTLTGYLYSSASQLYGVEINAEFCQLQEMIIAKYQFTNRVKVLCSDICTQASLLQNADVVVMNNVFEYFLDRLEQARAWEFISHNVRKKGSLLVTVPSLEESISNLQMDILLSQWVEEMKLDYDVYMEKDIDREALEQIHLYKIL